MAQTSAGFSTATIARAASKSFSQNLRILTIDEPINTLNQKFNYSTEFQPSFLGFFFQTYVSI